MKRFKRFGARTIALVVLGTCGFAMSLVFAGTVFATDTTSTSTTTETTTTSTTTETTTTGTTTTEPSGPGGCTPGYWKNHLASWLPTGYSPGQSLSTVFSAGALGSLGSDSLLDALSYNGGSGLEGAKRILLRAAVASLLNAAHPDGDFGVSPAVVIGAANFALASGSREGILDMAAQFDARNNAGCSIS